MNPERVDSWKCGSCGKVYTDRKFAEMCCVCRTCGKEGVRTSYAGGKCIDCQAKEAQKRERERWEKAAKIAPGEVDQCYIGRLELFCDESDVDSVLETADEWLFGDAPVEDGRSREEAYDYLHVYACEEVPIALSADRIIDELGEDAYEDYEIDPEGAEAIDDFCERWNRDYAAKMLVPDWKRGISALAEKEGTDG